MEDRIRELILNIGEREIRSRNGDSFSAMQNEFLKFQERAQMEKEFNELRAIEDKILHVQPFKPPNLDEVKVPPPDPGQAPLHFAPDPKTVAQFKLFTGRNPTGEELIALANNGGKFNITKTWTP